MIIREIEERDANNRQNLIYQLKNWKLNIDEVIEIIRNYKNDNYKAFVVKIDDIVVGLVAISITKSFVRTAKYCRIMALVVDENYRNMQIGRKLMLYAEACSKYNNCILINLTSNKKRKACDSIEVRFSKIINQHNI